MLDRDEAEKIARKWIDAWNSHDLDRIFDLYEDDFTMTSPYICSRMNIESGVLSGKNEVRPYWEKSLMMRPPLEFMLKGIFSGVSSVVVLYESNRGATVCETLEIDSNGKINSGCSQHGYWSFEGT
ncbi:nuclear transport factor 2 family protein [Parahaliea mediterranea]|uniref:nuclear transport factor 2 family protein n=1 Tax=Parahaliea mediterranea TaxID=651086 RepID=UPI001300B1F7|nr:nuclear transport factor 2 family protein [Parahaliea mediterranea]